MLKRVGVVGFRSTLSRSSLSCTPNTINYRNELTTLRIQYKFCSTDNPYDRKVEEKADLLDYHHKASEQQLKKKINKQDEIPDYPAFHMDTDSDAPSTYYDKYDPPKKMPSEEAKQKMISFLESITSRDVANKQVKELFEDEDREIEIDEEAKPKTKDYDSEDIDRAAWNNVIDNSFKKKYAAEAVDLTKEEQELYKEDDPQAAFLDNVEKQEEKLFELIASREFRDIDKMILAIFTDCAEEPFRAWK